MRISDWSSDVCSSDLWATRQEDRTKLWQARHDAYFANLAMKPGAKGWATDVCVPISRLAECILETRQDIDASGVLASIVVHVGDGNLQDRTSTRLNSSH